MGSNSNSTDEWKPQTVSPFEFVNSVCESKQDIFNEESQSGYNPYVINRALSNQPDCLFLANEMNQYPDVPKQSQYEFYLYSIEKKRRRGKWEKAEKNEDLVLVMETLNYSRHKAEQVLQLLDDNQLEEMRNRYGGRTTKRSSR